MKTPQEIAAELMSNFTVRDGDIDECSEGYVADVIAAAIEADRAQRAADIATLAERVASAEALVDMLADAMLADQMGGAFTCAEVETVASFLRAWDADAHATVWLDMHARDDDEGDAHHERGIEVNKQIETDGYSKPGGN